MSESAVDDGTGSQQPVPFISRVRLRNYKSIAECDVRLGPLTVLVGPNGSGKSNFLDALAFLARALETTPSEAIAERGGIAEIIRRVPEPTDSFSIAIEINVPLATRSLEMAQANYEFEIGRLTEDSPDAFEVVSEACELRWLNEVGKFRADHGNVLDEPYDGDVSIIERDRLYLAFAGIQRFFAPLFSRLRDMRFYNFGPEELRRPQQQSTGAVLGTGGGHLGDVLLALEKEGKGYKERIDAYLRAIVPSTAGIYGALTGTQAGTYTTLMLRSPTGLAGRDVNFAPEGMSDGTIRAVAVLAALFQPVTRSGRTRLIGIEEPEIALHPAAAGVLFDALDEASQHVQVVATSQSADLLDREDLSVSYVRAVTMQNGLTTIGEVDDASKRIVREKLYTVGELMRANQLAPQPLDEDGIAPRAS